MQLKKISLQLARNADFPEGSKDIGYEFYAPLDADGFLVSENWNTVKSECKVLRFWKNQDDEKGYLVRKKENHWIFDYDPNTDSDDEPIFRFDQHKFVEGEYVSVTEHDAVERTFKVVEVKDC